MSIYTKKPGLHGATIYIKDKRSIKTASVPGNIMELLKTQEAVDDSELSQIERPMSGCIFCKEPTKLTRTVNQQTVALCTKHYYSETIGRVAQQINLLAAPKVTGDVDEDTDKKPQEDS